MYEIEGGLSSFRKVNAHGNGVLTNPLTGDSVSIANLGTLKDGSNGGMLEAEFTDDKYKFNEKRSFDADPNYSNFKDGVYLKGQALLTGEYSTSVNIAITELDADYSYPAVVSVTGEKDKFKGITYTVNGEDVTSFKYGDKVTATLSLDDGYTGISKVNGTLVGSSSTFSFEASIFNEIEIEVKAKSNELKLISTYSWGLKKGYGSAYILRDGFYTCEGESVLSSSSTTSWKPGLNSDYLYSTTVSGDHLLTFTVSLDIEKVVISTYAETANSMLSVNGVGQAITSTSKDSLVDLTYDAKTSSGGQFMLSTTSSGVHIKSMSFYAYL